MHLVERQPGGLADDRLELGGILLARHLHEDAAGALAHDGRLGRPVRIDAPPHRLDRCRHGVARALTQAGLGRRDGEAAALAAAHLHVGAGAAQQRVAEGPDDLPQGLEGGVPVLRLREAHLDGVAGDADRGDGDLGLPQVLACSVAQRIEPVLANVVDLQRVEQVRAALQVEPERELLPGQPARPFVQHWLGQEIGQHQQEPKKAGEQDGGLLPPGKMQHGWISCLTRRSAPWRWLRTRLCLDRPTRRRAGAGSRRAHAHAQAANGLIRAGRIAPPAGPAARRNPRGSAIARREAARASGRRGRHALGARRQHPAAGARSWEARARLCDAQPLDPTCCAGRRPPHRGAAAPRTRSAP